MIHLHWAYLAKSELPHMDEITARCGAIVGLNEIAEDWGECRCKECKKHWGISRLAIMNRNER